MDRKIYQKMYLVVLILVALISLTIGKTSNSKGFYITYLVTSLIVINSVVGNGIGFNIFKHSNITRQIRISLVIDFIIITVALLLFQLNNKTCAMMMIILSLSSIIYNLYKIKE